MAEIMGTNNNNTPFLVQTQNLKVLEVDLTIGIVINLGRISLLNHKLKSNSWKISIWFSKELPLLLGPIFKNSLCKGRGSFLRFLLRLFLGFRPQSQASTLRLALKPKKSLWERLWRTFCEALPQALPETLLESLAPSLGFLPLAGPSIPRRAFEGAFVRLFLPKTCLGFSAPISGFCPQLGPQTQEEPEESIWRNFCEALLPSFRPSNPGRASQKFLTLYTERKDLGRIVKWGELLGTWNCTHLASEQELEPRGNW